MGHEAAAAHDAHGHDAHGHGHGHHASPLTREMSGTLGVFAAATVAVLGIIIDKKVGPIFPSGHHGGAGETLEWKAPEPGDADVILKNVHVHQPGYKTGTMIAVRHGKILGVATSKEDEDKLLARATPATVVHDLGGGHLFAGLRDAHGHMAGLGAALNLRVCDLREVNQSMDDVIRAFETWMKLKKGGVKPGELLVGKGWDESKWEKFEPPSREELIKAEKEGHDFTKDPHQGYRRVAAALPDSTDPIDAIAPDNPVILYRVDGHTAWVNFRALQLAGITVNSPNPPGGRILRDKQGEPTGILLDKAIDLVLDKLPKKSDDAQILEAEEDFLAAAQACAKAGLVEVHEAGITMNQELALRRLAKDGRLPIRVYAMVTGTRDQIAERLSRQQKPDEAKVPIGDRLTVHAVKLIADGSMGGHGALLLAPYSDEPGTSGLPTLSKEEIAGTARLCFERGWQLCVHAIGDRANRDVLDVFESVLGDGGADRRWRIEHAQLVDPTDFPRFARLGVIASMQPTHATTDMRWAEARIGKERLAGAYAWRSLLDAKYEPAGEDGHKGHARHTHMAFGSDFPVESERPLLGLYAAVTRQDAEGKPDDGWLPKERVTPAEALALFTEGPAYASFAEGRRGKILVGMDADFTVFDKDPIELLSSEEAKTRREALTAKVVGTFVGGKDATK